MWRFELTGDINPFEGLQVDLGYTYLNAEILDVSPVVLPAGAPYIISGQPLPGYTLPLTPHNKYTIGVNYTLPLGENIGPVTVGALFAHTDHVVSNYADTSAVWSAPFANIQDTNLLNLNLTWTSMFGKSVDLLIFATNVTGQKHYTYIPTLGGSASPLGFETAAVGAPTMYGARLTYHFGED
jgi:iron complex outermembrane receptor protein